MGAAPSARRQSALSSTLPSQPEENLKRSADFAIRQPAGTHPAQRVPALIDLMIRADLVPHRGPEILTDHGYPQGTDRGCGVPAAYAAREGSWRVPPAREASVRTTAPPMPLTGARRATCSAMVIASAASLRTSGELLMVCHDVLSRSSPALPSRDP